MGDATVEQVLALARELSAADKRRLLDELVPELEAAVDAVPAGDRSSAYGALSELGASPSSEDIEEVHREMLRDFPRRDVA